MLVRGAVSAVIVVLLALPVQALSVAHHPSGWGQRFKSFFELRDTSAPRLLKQLSVGVALIAALGYSTVFYGQVLHDFVGDNRAVHSDTMLNTIIRFDDDIIGRTFHFTANGRHYKAEAVAWNPPYNRMLLYSDYADEHILVPVENLLGKAIMWHEHDYAQISFIDPDYNSHLLHGKVLKVFDSDYYYTVAEAQENRSGIVTPLDERRLVFVAKKLITTIALYTH